MCLPYFVRFSLLTALCLACAFTVVLAGDKEPKGDSSLYDIFKARESLLNKAVATFAEDPKRPEETLSKIDQDLLFFCESGRLVNRGVTTSVFAGPTDSWLVNHAFHDQVFATFLKITPEQLEKTTLEDERYYVQPSAEEQHKEALIRLHSGPGWGYRYWLKEHLTLEQQGKLPLIYLNVEGLLALHRSVFQNLIGITLEEQRRIAKQVDNYKSEYMGIHRALAIGLKPHERYIVPVSELLLRWQSANLDLKILVMLNKQQRKKLHALLENNKICKHIQGPGAWPDLRIKHVADDLNGSQ